MNMFSFKKKFYLKYSHIENICFGFYDQKLIATLNFANWMQELYEESQPSHIIGNHIFSGAENINLSSKNLICDDNQILDLNDDFLSEDPNETRIEFITSSPEGFVVLSFKAASVQWKPLLSEP